MAIPPLPAQVDTHPYHSISTSVNQLEYDISYTPVRHRCYILLYDDIRYTSSVQFSIETEDVSRSLRGSRSLHLVPSMCWMAQVRPKITGTTVGTWQGITQTMADLNVVKTNILMLYWYELYVLVIEQMLRSEYVLWLDRRGRRWKHWGRWSFRSSTQRTWLQQSWHSWITTWAKYRHSVVVKTSCGIARNTQSNNWENCQTTGLAALNAPSFWVATSIDYPLASFNFLHKKMLGSSGLL